MKQKNLDQYHHLTRGMLELEFKMAITQNFIIWFKHKSALHIYKLRCTCSANFVKIHLAVFEIPSAEDFLPKILKTSIKCTILNFKKI